MLKYNYTLWRNKYFKLTINKIKLFQKNKSTIIDACKKLKIEIPRFCYHEKLSIAGNCRMCLVEVQKSLKPVASCAFQVMNNGFILTNTTLVKKAREGVLEFLLANHPLDCPICDQGGECDLQDQVMIFGGDKGRFYEYKRAVEDKECGPLIKTLMTRCIHCTRCVRFSTEVIGLKSLGVLGRGNSMEIGTYLEKNLFSEFSGNIIDLCPVGALTSKPYAFKARSWELVNIDSLDILDNVGSDLKVNFRGTEIMRVLPKLLISNRDLINDPWITDKARFSYDGIKLQRLKNPLIKKSNSEKYLITSWNYIFNRIWLFFYINKFILNKKINLFSFYDSFIELESIYLLKIFTNYFGSSFHTLKNEINNNNTLVNFYSDRNYYLLNKDLNFLEKNDLLFLFNINVRLESPLLNLKIRKLYINNKLFIISLSQTLNLSYYVKQIGISSDIFFKFIKGNNYLSNLLLHFKNPYFFLGESILYRKDNLSFLEGIKFLLKKFNHNFCFFNKSMTQNLAFDLGLSSGINYNFDSTLKNYNNNDSYNFFYFFNNDHIFLNNRNFKNSCFIYQGHHGNFNTNQLINILLPGLTYFEKRGSYLNIEGKIKKINSIIKILENDQKKDIDILFFLLKFFYINYNNLNLKKEIKNKFFNNNVIFNFNNIFFSVFYKFYFIYLNLNNISFINIKKYNILSYINNLFINNFFKKYYYNENLINEFIINEESINNKLKKILPFYYKNKEYLINSNILLKNYNNLFNKIFNSPFNSLINNYYNSDIISKSSITMSLCSKKYKKIYSNFF